MSRLTLLMIQPLRRLRYRLAGALTFGTMWFVLPFLSTGRSATGVVLGATAAAFHVWLWLFGPSGHERPPKAPAVDSSFPTWVERESR